MATNTEAYVRQANVWRSRKEILAAAKREAKLRKERERYHQDRKDGTYVSR